MTRRIFQIAWECLFDLGVMVIYAAMAGLAIAAVSVSGRGLGALLPALGYALLLPLAVLAMIVVDASVRALAERRAAVRAGGMVDRFRAKREPAIR